MKQHYFAFIQALAITLLLAGWSFTPTLAQDATQPHKTFSASGTINSLIFETESTTTASSANSTDSNTMQRSTDAAGGNASSDDRPTPLLKGLEKEQRGNVIAGNQSTQFEGQSLKPGPASKAPTSVYNSNSLAPYNPQNNSSNTQTAGQQNNQTRKLSMAEIARVLPEQMYIVGGNWSVQVTNGNVSDMSIDFVMVHPGGSEEHVHSFTNVVSNRTAELKQGGNATIAATADIEVNGSVQWKNAFFVLQIENGKTASITIDSISTDNHFQGQPIYGITNTLLPSPGG